jgi:RNA polymerase sigma-70 factor (ECF subfamily)
MEPRDEDLMRDVQDGRIRAFDELVRRYRQPLLRVAASKLIDRASAEDVVQETFLAAFAARGTYRPELPFRTWLWTILLHLCYRHARKQARTAVPPWESVAPQPAVVCQSAESRGGLNQLLAAEKQELLHAALAKLPEVQADALRLRFFGGLKFEEIAAAMNCSLNGAKQRVKQGLLKLAGLVPPPEEQES